MVLGDLGVSGISMFSMMDLDMRMILEMWILPWMILRSRFCLVDRWSRRFYHNTRITRIQRIMDNYVLLLFRHESVTLFLLYRIIAIICIFIIYVIIDIRLNVS